jgi:hypothetical protein
MYTRTCRRRTSSLTRCGTDWASTRPRIGAWLNIPALKRQEMSKIVRTQSGTYPHFPVVVGGMKKLPGVKNEGRPDFTFGLRTDGSHQIHAANARTVCLRRAGPRSVFSRTLEMQNDLAAFIAEDHSATDPRRSLWGG